MKSKIAERLGREVPKHIKNEVSKYSKLVVLINYGLGEKGLNKKDFADSMDKNPSEITKWLKGDHNFTLSTLLKLESTLGITLIEIPEIPMRYTFKGRTIGGSVVSTYGKLKMQHFEKSKFVTFNYGT